MNKLRDITYWVLVAGNIGFSVWSFILYANNDRVISLGAAIVGMMVAIFMICVWRISHRTKSSK